MGKENISDLEQTYQEAFAFAQQNRKAVGLPALKPQLTVVRQGPNKSARVGPANYKLTLWLTAAEYVDLLRHRENTGYTGGPTGLIRQAIREFLPPKQRAAAPKPRPSLGLAEAAPVDSRIRKFKYAAGAPA